MRAAMLDDPLHLFMDELYTTEARLLQPTDLTLYQQLKGYLWHE